MTHPPVALLVATMDTKGREALYIADCIKKEGISVKIMDAGIRGTSPVPVDIRREKVALSRRQAVERRPKHRSRRQGPEYYDRRGRQMCPGIV